MSLWLGILSSSAIGADYENIATVSVGAAGASSISFSSIPAIYAHLQIRANWRASTASELEVSFNSDTTNSNYRRHVTYSTGASSAATSQQLRTVGGYFESGTNIFCSSIIDIIDYSLTSKNTTVRCFWGNDYNGAGNVGINSMLWMNTSTISSIVLTPSGGTFSQNSTYSLYGIKAP